MKTYPKNIFFFNVVKLFNSGYAQRCSPLLERYNMWTFIVPSLAKSTNKDGYMEYLRKVMVEDSEDGQFIMAKFLLPRVKELKVTTTEDKAIEQALMEQSETAPLSDLDKEKIMGYLKILE